jgi:hypothetical protein
MGSVAPWLALRSVFCLACRHPCSAPLRHGSSPNTLHNTYCVRILAQSSLQQWAESSAAGSMEHSGNMSLSDALCIRSQAGESTCMVHAMMRHPCAKPLTRMSKVQAWMMISQPGTGSTTSTRLAAWRT